MRAEQTLKSLCRRHGVAEDFGRRLLPLLQRAETATPDVRDRLLQLVEQSLERESERQRSLRENTELRDERALQNVARALHGWTPPKDFDPSRHDPEDLDPDTEPPDDFLPPDLGL